MWSWMMRRALEPWTFHERAAVEPLHPAVSGADRLAALMLEEETLLLPLGGEGLQRLFDDRA